MATRQRNPGVAEECQEKKSGTQTEGNEGNQGMSLKTYTVWGDENAVGDVQAENVDDALRRGKEIWPGRAKAAWLMATPRPPQSRAKYVAPTSPANQQLRSEPMFEPGS